MGDVGPDAEGGTTCMNWRKPRTVAKKITAGWVRRQPADSQAKEHSVSEKTPDDIFKLAKDENIEYV
ncbi:hypothetical protein, partial [Mycobacterium sp.]|uniref:hypothetical protein n=1 Tax=Mycobacterium sp. TaxID=1785 RepID=UPI003C778B3E